ncbi:hypothetical protein J6590_089543 [Homalodisca vitripennis]|nr:hypothetical protein J6590_089543 [Homalodisca vitripennis]
MFQQDGAPPHWHNNVRQLLNNTLPHRWIGRTGPRDNALHSWPPRSPDLTPCDFFLTKEQSNVAIRSVNADTVCKVYEELSYRLDVVRAAAGGHTGIEHL